MRSAHPELQFRDRVIELLEEIALNTRMTMMHAERKSGIAANLQNPRPFWKAFNELRERLFPWVSAADSVEET